jgi:hypothetical protein
LREILATVQVPSYLADDSGQSTLHFAADGVTPKMRALVDVPIVIHIPQCAKAATRSLPLVTFGHGLFGNALETMARPDLQQAADEQCAVFIGTDWIGLSSFDIPNIRKFLASDLNNTNIVTDRLQQAHVNTLVMTRLVLTEIRKDPAMAIGGRAVVTGDEVYYFGVSNGGIQGTTFMALTPDIERAVLTVPGCEWTLLIYRSTDFNGLKPLLNSLYSDPLDAQVVIASTQSEWDYTDPATFAPHVVLDPLPNMPPKRILLQESIGDARVTNVSTRVLARTMGVPGMDLEMPIYGITQQPAPLDSAYTQWDSHPSPMPPPGDAALQHDNGAHEAVYQQPDALAQIRAFLTPSGQVTQTCQGPCAF